LSYAWPGNLPGTLLWLAAVLVDFEFDAKFQILDYEVVVERDGITIFQEINGTGTGKFSTEVDEFIHKKIRVNDRISFRHVRAKGPDDLIRLLNDISFVMH
jgi:hypothetical protein